MIKNKASGKLSESFYPVTDRNGLSVPKMNKLQGEIR